MEKKSLFTIILAFAGMVLVSLPILAPIFFCLIVFLRNGMFHLDYLMPGEFFPVVFTGGGLLLWAAIRAHSHVKLIGWSFGAALLLLAFSLSIAQVTGLASGATDPNTSPWMALVQGGIIGYNLLVILMGVAGILIIRDSYREKN